MPGRRLEVEVDPGVQAALTEVAVEGAAVAVPLVQLPQVAEVAAEPVRRDRGVLPALPGERLARHQRGGAQAGLAHLPDQLLVGWVVDQLGADRAVPATGQGLDELLSTFVALLAAVRPQLDHKPATPFGQHREIVGVQALALHVVDQDVVEALQRDRLELQHVRDVVGGLVDVRVAEQHQHLDLGRGHQPAGRLEDGHAGRFAAHQRTRHVEAVLRQQLLQAVAGDAARDPREALADQLGVAVPQRREVPVDLAAAAAGGDDAAQLVVAGRPDPHAHPVVGEDLQLRDVLAGAAGHLRVRAAGVVADHAADGAVVVGGRVRAEGQAVPPRRLVQRVADDPRLHAGDPLPGVELEDAVQVLGVVQHHGDVAALARQAGPAGTVEHRRAVLGAGGHGRHHVVGRRRHHHADRHLPVVRPVGGIRRPASGVEPDLPADGPVKGILERADVHVGARLAGFRQPWPDRSPHRRHLSLRRSWPAASRQPEPRPRGVSRQIAVTAPRKRLSAAGSAAPARSPPSATTRTAGSSSPNDHFG